MKRPNQTENPPGCFSWVVPETGHRIPFAGNTSIDNVVKQAVAYYRANGYAVPSCLRDRIEDECCKRQPAGYCLDDHRLPSAPLRFTTALEAVVAGTRTVATWLTRGKVSDAVAASRAAVCKTCPKHAEIENASTCKTCGFASRLHQFGHFVSQVLQSKTDFDEGLKACSVCHCNLSLKVRCQLSAIREYTPAETMAAFPPECWIVKESQAL